MDLVLIGAGRVGTAVAALLQRNGHRILGVASRTTASAERAGAFLEAPVYGVTDLPPAECSLLGVPAGALQELADKLSADKTEIAVHFAGAVGISPLEAVTERGVSVAALHPVQTCPDITSALELLPGSAWGMTTSPEIAAWARRLITQDLRGFPIELSQESRPTWHAAAVTTANGITALLSLGEAMLASLSIDRPADVLGPLAAGAVATARSAPNAVDMLTGPVVRGEADAIRAHATALAHNPELLDAYALVTRTILLAARLSERLDDSLVASIEEVLQR